MLNRASFLTRAPSCRHAFCPTLPRATRSSDWARAPLGHTGHRGRRVGNRGMEPTPSPRPCAADVGSPGPGPGSVGSLARGRCSRVGVSVSSQLPATNARRRFRPGPVASRVRLVQAVAEYRSQTKRPQLARHGIARHTRAGDTTGIDGVELRASASPDLGCREATTARPMWRAGCPPHTAHRSPHPPRCRHPLGRVEPKPSRLSYLAIV